MNISRLRKKIDIGMNTGAGTRRRFLLTAAVCGAAFYLLEYLFCLFFNASFAVMGVQAKELTDIVLANFKGVILLSQGRIILAYLLLGALAGLAAGYILVLLSRRGKKFLIKHIVIAVSLFCLAGTAAFLFHDIALRPALYNETFYAAGGLRKYIQVFLTDYFPFPVLSILRYAVMLAYVPLLIAVFASAAKGLLKIFRRLPLRARIASGGLITVLLAIYLFPVRGNEGPNLIILSADSFRYDRVSAYGYDRDLTPHINRLVEEGFSLKNFHVQLPRTFPSWFTLLSGKYPQQHGIRSMFPSPGELGRSEPDLLSILKKQGYTTSAVADYAGDIFPRTKGFDRVKAPAFSFDTVVEQRSLEIHFLLLPWLQNRGARRLFPELQGFAQNSDPRFLEDEVIRELKDLKERKKFALTVFYSATHFPYAAPRPWYGIYADRAYRGEYRYLKINNPLKESVVTEADRRQIVALFDGACRAVDDSIGRVIAYLKESGLYDNSIIVFTADHGENLYDHGLDLGHGEHFRGEWTTHVPLIIKFPGNRARHIRVKSYSGVSEQVDFLPTVLDALGLQAKGDYPGVSMMAIAEGRRKSVEKIAYAETGIWFVDTGSQFFQKQRIMYPDVSRLCRVEGRGNQIVLKEEYRELIIIAKHRTVFDGRFKLIYIPTREGVRWELYRIGDASFTNLYREDHPEFRRLYRHLKDFEERYGKARVVHGFFLTEP